MINGVSKDINDVVLFHNEEGFVCRVGNLAFHGAHPESNWRDVRTQNEGRLEFVIDSAIRLLDPEKLSRLGGST